MAKCPICNSRKGKRYCKLSDTAICSLCCAETRKPDTCIGCNHYRDPKPQEKYKEYPMFSLQRMDDDIELQSYANAIESAFCAFDHQEKRQLTDPTILKILELLLDKYYLKETIPFIEDKLVEKGFYLVVSIIREDLAEVSEKVITRLIGSIYFVAKRRSKGNREYLDFIHLYVGIRVGKGLRSVKLQSPHFHIPRT